MTDLALFLLQFCIPVFTGLAVTLYLRDVLRQLLAEICGTADRAELWVHITAVLLLTVPLLMVLLFGRGAVEDGVTRDIVRQTFSLSLIGVVAAVLVLARAIWKQIPAPPAPGAEGGA